MSALVTSIQTILSDLRRLEEDLDRTADDPAFSAMAGEERVQVATLLEQLVIHRIAVTKSFELLVRLDPERAVTLLCRRYLGKNVNPDRKFGGYESELESMLADLAEVGGDWLVALVRTDAFDEAKMQDPRVVASFCEVLKVQSRTDFESWFLSARGAPPPDQRWNE